MNKLTIWERQIEMLIKVDGTQLPDDYDCYITVDPKSDRCKYYFVDHITQTVFWLEEIDPERHDIGLQPVCSTAQMSEWIVSAQACADQRPWHGNTYTWPGISWT